LIAKGYTGEKNILKIVSILLLTKTYYDRQLLPRQVLVFMWQQLYDVIMRNRKCCIWSFCQSPSHVPYIYKVFVFKGQQIKIEMKKPAKWRQE